MGPGRTAATAATRNLRTQLHPIMTRTTYALNPVLKWRPGLKDGAEVLLLAMALPLYYLVRGQVHQRVDEAVQRGIGVVSLEKSLGIFWDVQFQRAILVFGRNMLVGIALWLSTRNPFLRALAVLMPLGMFTDIILTANHYLLDPILAIPVVALGLAITLGGRWLVLRALSPESKSAKEHGWVSW